MKGKLVSAQVLSGAAMPTMLFQFELAEIKGQNLNLLGLDCQVRTESPMKPMLIGSLSCHDFGPVENGRQINVAICLDYPALNAIENARKAIGTPEKDVWFRIQGEAFVARTLPRKIEARRTDEMLLEDVRFYRESFAARHGNYGDGIIRIPETDWLRWLQDWGRNSRTIFASDAVAERLSRMFQELGASSDEDFIDKVEKSLVELRRLKEGVGINQSFLYTLPQEKRIRSKLTEVLNRAAGRKGEVLATGWVDGALEAEIHEVLRNGGRVRIVTRKSSEKSVIDAVNRLRKSGAKIKTNNMIHARVIVAEDECIVSSADLKSDSLDLNREAGVYTTDPVIVLSVKDFFEKLWMDEESVDLK